MKSVNIVCVACLLQLLFANYAESLESSSSTPHAVPLLIDNNNTVLAVGVPLKRAVAASHARDLFVAKNLLNDENAAIAHTTFFFAHGTASPKLRIEIHCMGSNGAFATACNKAELLTMRMYVVLRVTNHWEKDFGLKVWQDTEGTSRRSWLTSGSREELVETCLFLSECYLTNHMTYTGSYKIPYETAHSTVPEETAAGRIIVRIDDVTSAAEWNVQILNGLPHDASAKAELVVYLVKGTYTYMAVLIMGTLATLGVLAAIAVALILLKFIGCRRRGVFQQNLILHDTTFLERLRKFIVTLTEQLRVLKDATKVYISNAVTHRKRSARRRLSATARAEDTSVTIPNGGDESHNDAMEMTPQQPDSPAGSESSLSNADEDAPTCRICHSTTHRDDMISPCMCTGSSRYVHQRCLQQWIEMTTNPVHRQICAGVPRSVRVPSKVFLLRHAARCLLVADC